ncbi:unnamed protein product, partial [Ectocarpus sp. 4 AP-2014]
AVGQSATQARLQQLDAPYLKMGTMKVFLENIRSMARSPTQYNRTQQERIASQEAEFEAAVTASLVEAGGYGYPVL